MSSVKESNILICPVEDLHSMPDSERQIVRDFLFKRIRGANAVHDKRWRRLWAEIWNADPGDLKEIANREARNLRFHNAWMAFEQRLFDNQEVFVHEKAFRDWLKTGAAFGEYKLVRGEMKFVPSSVAFEHCSEDEMREFVDAAMEFLHTPWAQAELWPHLRADKRQRALEAIERDPQH
jgi:hypothetical protein